MNISNPKIIINWTIAMKSRHNLPLLAMRTDFRNISFNRNNRFTGEL
jgi:hypothetical protein